MQESCMQDLHGTCTRYVPFLARFLHYLARSYTYLARNGARFCKRCCKNNYLQIWSFLHHFLLDVCKILHDSARIVQEKGHIACTCHASLACKILAQSCMILQVRFCWAVSDHKRINYWIQEPTMQTLRHTFKASLPVFVVSL